MRRKRLRNHWIRSGRTRVYKYCVYHRRALQARLNVHVVNREEKQMKFQKIPITLICLLIFVASYQNVDAQQDIAQEAYAIFADNCLNCHGE